jgi:NAD(P)H-flavin reductase
MLPTPYRVRRNRRELPGIYTIELERQDGGAAPAFAPGQFNMLYVFGVGEIPISISGDPAERSLLVHTTRAVGPVSRAICALQAGAVIGVRGPFGTSWPLEQAVGKDVVIVAGGIGLPPLRPAIYAILARRAEYGRVSLLYGARTPGDIVYRRELERWRSRFDLDVAVTVDHATSAWRGGVGVVITLIARAAFDPARTVAFIVGPEIMMRFCAAELLKRGVAAERIFVSLERNMKCALGFCGHCQYGPVFVCRDGPIFAYSRVQRLLSTPEL